MSITPQPPIATQRLEKIPHNIHNRVDSQKKSPTTFSPADNSELIDFCLITSRPSSSAGKPMSTIKCQETPSDKSTLKLLEEFSCFPSAGPTIGSDQFLFPSDQRWRHACERAPERSRGSANGAERARSSKGRNDDDKRVAGLPHRFRRSDVINGARRKRYASESPQRSGEIKRGHKNIVRHEAARSDTISYRL